MAKRSHGRTQRILPFMSICLHIFLIFWILYYLTLSRLNNCLISLYNKKTKLVSQVCGSWNWEQRLLEILSLLFFCFIFTSGKNVIDHERRSINFSTVFVLPLWLPNGGEKSNGLEETYPGKNPFINISKYHPALQVKTLPFLADSNCDAYLEDWKFSWAKQFRWISFIFQNLRQKYHV